MNILLNIALLLLFIWWFWKHFVIQRKKVLIGIIGLFCFSGWTFSQTEEIRDTLYFTDQNCPVIYTGNKINKKKTGEWITNVDCQNKSDSIILLENWRRGRLISRLYYRPSSKPKFPRHSNKEVYSRIGGLKAYFTYRNDTLSSSRKRCFVIPFLWKAKRYDHTGNLIAEGLLRKKIIKHYGELGSREIYIPIGKWRKYDTQGNLIEVKKYRDGELVKTKKLNKTNKNYH